MAVATKKSVKLMNCADSWRYTLLTMAKNRSAYTSTWIISSRATYSMGAVR